MVSVCDESWLPIMELIEQTMERIKTNMNLSYVDKELEYIITQSRKTIQNKLQDNIVALAVQQRNIARMYRQLNAAMVFVPKSKIIYYYLPYNILLLQLIIAFMIGVILKKKYLV